MRHLLLTVVAVSISAFLVTGCKKTEATAAGKVTCEVCKGDVDLVKGSMWCDKCDKPVPVAPAMVCSGCGKTMEVSGDKLTCKACNKTVSLSDVKLKCLGCDAEMKLDTSKIMCPTCVAKKAIPKLPG